MEIFLKRKKGKNTLTLRIKNSPLKGLFLWDKISHTYMKYHIITFGCQMNKSDSERIAAVLESAGCDESKDMAGADLIVVNMCSVRQSAVDRIFGLGQKFRKLKIENRRLKTILTGCILKKDKRKFTELFDYVLDIGKLSKWPRLLGLNSPKKYRPKYSGDSSAFLPISNGCNNFCAYCVVPFTRGRLICRDHKKILKEAKSFVEKEFKEIWLLGQNVNDYQSPANPSINFAKLLKMVNDIPGNFKIFFMSPNPKNFSGELINVMAECEKFSKYLNLPVQSGDNEILRRMNRPYTVAQYKNLVKKIRKKIPDINLSTDVIVGFPGETKKQFNDTAKLFKDIKFNIAYISKYSPRLGTAAYKIKDDVPVKEKKRREKILQRIIDIERQTKPKIDGHKSCLPVRQVITILGPNASGKTGLSIKLAKKFGGEIVSADSRQVYKGMNIGTGKATKKEMQGVPHYLLDVVSPKKIFDVSQYKNLALKAIDKIYKKGKVPFLVGGTGFYIQAVADNILLPEIKPDWNLRRKLEKKPVSKLFSMLQKLDPRRASNIDKNNPRRLIRALEIVLKSKRPVGPLSAEKTGFKVLFLGVKKDKNELKKLIEKRLLKRLDEGMINEVKKLHRSGVSWKRLEEFGLEYRYVAQYLQKKLKYEEMVSRLQKEIEHYAKRQMTWFKRDSRVHWVKSYREAEKMVERFLIFN
jgi:tRNA dimethylallyltransferase